MADDVLVDNGDEADFTVSADDASGKYVQRVKLAYSADGSATHVPADADGLLVNLGANNDVVVSDGGSTISVDDGGSTISVDGTVGVLGNYAEDLGHTTGDTGVFVLGVRNTAMGTQTSSDGDYSPITVDSAGRTNVAGQVAHDQQSNGNPLSIGGVAFAAAPSDVSQDADAVRAWFLRNGAQAVNLTAAGALIPGDASNGLDVDVTRMSALVAGTATIGAVNVKPTTSGGLSIFRSIDLDETEEDVKTSAGQLFGWYLYNAHSAVLYVKLYNATAANVTVGTTTPVMTIPVPPSSGANVEFTNGIAFSTAICAACTTGVADNDTGAPAANVLIANFLYA